MKLRQHPEYTLYHEHQTQAERYRQAVAGWPANGPTRVAAETLLAALTSLLQTYNRILWYHFPYCGQCLGGCCVVGATDLKPVDYVALALLEEALPLLPRHTGRDERACVYLTSTGCSWPASWRPLKCALFYCLGSGAIAVDASDVRYGEMTVALEAAIGPRLGQLLPEAADALLPLLPDPVAFADALVGALEEKLLFPLYESAPGLRPAAGRRGASESNATTGALAFIAAATEQVWDNPPAPLPGSDLTAEQFLADLETLEWLLQGRPAAAAPVLAEMARRYPPPDGALPSLWQEMADQIDHLRASLPPQ